MTRVGRCSEPPTPAFKTGDIVLRNDDPTTCGLLIRPVEDIQGEPILWQVLTIEKPTVWRTGNFRSVPRV